MMEFEKNFLWLSVDIALKIPSSLDFLSGLDESRSQVFLYV